MTLFWIVAALFLLGALLFLLPPLLSALAVEAPLGGASLAVHRDHLREIEADVAAGLMGANRLEQARAEVGRRAIEDARAAQATLAGGPARRTAVVVALLLPLASVLTYLQLGDPQAAAPSVASAAGERHATGVEPLQQRVTVLAERLKAAPNDADGWVMLARSYTTLQRYRDAAMALRRAVDLLPPNASLLADLADLTGMAQGRRLAGEPARLVQQALDVDPRHAKALSLAGSVAFESRDYAAARGYWERLLAALPPGSPQERSVRGSLLEAAQLEGGQSMAGTAAATAPATTAAVGRPATAAGPARVSGEVVLSAELATRVQPGDTLFVFARAAQGPRMPLAIVRRPADGRPFAFVLDDSMAMSAQSRLSSVDQVVVGARISRSGNATPQAGDLIGQSASVSPRTEGLRITIDRVQP